MVHGLAFLAFGSFVRLWKSGMWTYVFGLVVLLLLEMAIRGRRNRIRMFQNGVPTKVDRSASGGDPKEFKGD